MLTKVEPGSDVSPLTKLALVKNHRLIVSESEIHYIVDSILEYFLNVLWWGGVWFPSEFGVLVHPHFWLESLAYIAPTPLGAHRLL